MKKIRVILIIDNFETGGAQQVLYDLIKYAPQDELEFCIVGLGQKARYLEKYESLGIAAHALNLKKYDSRVVSRLGPLIKAFAPDIIHLNLFKSILFGAALQKKFGGKLVISEHSRTYDAKVRDVYFPHKALSKLYLYMFKKRLASVDHIIVLTAEDKRMYSDIFRQPPDKISVIPNGIDTLAIVDNLAGGTARRDFFARHHISKREDCNVVGFLGRFSAEKGCLEFVDGIKYLDDRNIPIIGVMAGDGEEKAAVVKAIADMSLQDKVCLTGYIPHEDISAFFTAIDFFWLTSRAESFGIVLIEAMGHKIPAIAYRSGGPIEIITNGENGVLVSEQTGKAFAEATLKLITDPALRESIALTGQKTVKAKFDIRETANRHAQLYRRLLEN